MSYPPKLPAEIVDEIILLLGKWAGEPTLAYRVATKLHRAHIMSALLPLLPWRDFRGASADGLVGLLQHFKDSGALPHQLCTRDPMHLASRNGHVDVLEWWKMSGLKLEDSYYYVMDTASENGHVDVLEWWKNSGLSFQSMQPLVGASRNGHVNVMEWWKQSGLDLGHHCEVLASDSRNIEKASGLLDRFERWRGGWYSFAQDVQEPWMIHHPRFYKYPWAEMDRASEQGYVDVLEWWKNSDLRFRYSRNAILFASKEGRVNVLEWWKNSGIPIKLTGEEMDEASMCRNFHVLDWWKSSGLPLKYSKLVMEKASRRGYIDVLDWWRNSGLKLELSGDELDNANRQNRIEVFQWWKDSGLEFSWSESIMDNASGDGDFDVLDWWKDSGLQPKYSSKAIHLATANGQINVLDWWKSSKLPLIYDECFVVRYAILHCVRKVQMLEWWKKSGLLVEWIPPDGYEGWFLQKDIPVKEWLEEHKAMLIPPEASRCSFAECKRARRINTIRRLLGKKEIPSYHGFGYNVLAELD